MLFLCPTCSCTSVFLCCPPVARGERHVRGGGVVVLHGGHGDGHPPSGPQGLRPQGGHPRVGRDQEPQCPQDSTHHGVLSAGRSLTPLSVCPLLSVCLSICLSVPLPPPPPPPPPAPISCVPLCVCLSGRDWTGCLLKDMKALS